MGVKKLNYLSRIAPKWSQSYTLVFLVSSLATGITAVLFGQDNNWDLRNYHIYNAFAYLTERGDFDILAAQVQSFFNPLPDLLLTLLFNNFKPIIGGFLLGLIHGINYFLIFRISLEIFSDIEIHEISIKKFSFKISPFKMALLMGVAAFFAPASFNLLATSYHDNLISIPLLFSLLQILKALNDGQENKFSLMLWSGLAAGLAFGLKMTASIYIMATILALIFILPTLKTKIRLLSAYALGGLSGALLSSGFWYYKMWSSYENPIFPFYNAIFKSSHFLNVTWRDARYVPKSFIDGLLYPFYFMYDSAYTYGQGSYTDLRFAILFLLFIALAYFVLRRRISKDDHGRLSRRALFVLLFSALSYTIWLLQFSIYRYLFALEALAFVTIAIIVYEIFSSRQKATGIIFGLVLITVIYGYFPRYHRIPWQENYINASIPALEGIDSSVVILGGKRPSAFLAPLFPATTRFIRLSSNIHSYISAESIFSERTFELLEFHTGNFYLITWDRFIPSEIKLLKPLNLEIDISQSWRIINPHEPQLQIWRVNRK